MYYEPGDSEDEEPEDDEYEDRLHLLEHNNDDEEPEDDCSDDDIECQRDYDRRYDGPMGILEDYGNDDDLIDGVGFAEPGGRSSLRAATPNNPRIFPCPTCHAENVLTRIDVQRGYQCDRCADRAEGRMCGDY